MVSSILFLSREKNTPYYDRDVVCSVESYYILEVTIMTEFDREVKIKEIEAAFYAIRRITKEVDVNDPRSHYAGVDKAVAMIRSFCDDINRNYNELK